MRIGLNFSDPVSADSEYIFTDISDITPTDPKIVALVEQWLVAAIARPKDSSVRAQRIRSDRTSHYQGWSQWVDATLACSLLAGVSNPKVFRGR